MDENETTSVSKASDEYDSYNLPEGIFHHQHNGQHWVHKIYRKLNTPLKSSTITKENICIICCCSLDEKKRDSHVWKIFVKTSALENMKKHIKKIILNLSQPNLLLNRRYQRNKLKIMLKRQRPW